MKGKDKRQQRTMLFTVLIALLLAIGIGPATARASYYTDVSDDAWYADAVAWASRNGIMHGYSDGRFGPEDRLLREQAAAVLYNYLADKATTVPATTLHDVDQSAWYATSINWAVSSGTMTGYSGSGRFGVGDALTREQVAVMMARVCKADLSKVDYTKFNAFHDNSSTSSWARASIAWAVENGIINGFSNANGTRTLSPQGTITRAQMAAIMRNAVEVGLLSRSGSGGQPAGQTNPYKSVLDAYRAGLASDTQPTSSYVNPEAWSVSKNNGKRMMYALSDLNGDGTKELIIGVHESTASPVDGTTVGYRVFDLYTLVSNKPVRVLPESDSYSLGYRSICIPCEGSVLEVWGSGGASYELTKFYRMGSRANALDKIGEVAVDHDTYTITTGSSGSTTLSGSAGRSALATMAAAYTPIKDFSWTAI